MYNLNRASQIAFQGEDVLHRARTFSYEFLRQREAQGMLRDKWIIAKDLAGEVIQTILPFGDLRLIKTWIEVKIICHKGHDCVPLYRYAMHKNIFQIIYDNTYVYVDQ